MSLCFFFFVYVIKVNIICFVNYGMYPICNELSCCDREILLYNASCCNRKFTNMMIKASILRVIQFLKQFWKALDKVDVGAKIVFLKLLFKSFQWYLKISRCHCNKKTKTMSQKSTNIVFYVDMIKQNFKTACFIMCFKTKIISLLHKGLIIVKLPFF